MLHKFPLKADKTPACLSWKTHISSPSELTESLLSGIMVPRGCVVLDLDTYKGVTEEKVEKVLGCSLDWKDAEIQKTPRGGKHYAFTINKKVELTQGSNLLGVVGFDTRCSEKGYIATGKTYEDLSLVGLENTLTYPKLRPKLPEKAVEALSARVINEASDFVAMVESESKANLSDEDVEFYVNKLTKAHSEDSDTWIRVGMALYHQTSGSELGWSLFDTFSQKSKGKYNLEQNRARWESFNGKGKSSQIKFGTIIKLAGGIGELSVKIVSDVSSKIAECVSEKELLSLLKPLSKMGLSPIDEGLVVLKIKHKFRELAGHSISLPSLRSELTRLRTVDYNRATGDFIKKYVFITSADVFMHRGTKTTRSIRGFDLENRSRVPLTPEGKKMAPSIYASDHCTFVDHSMYAPAFPSLFTHKGLRYINTYTKSPLAKVLVGTTDIVARVIGHIAHIIDNGREREIFTSYLAHNVQFPGEKLHWAILLQGVPGDGKSFFAELMQHVLGLDNVRLLNSSDLESTFTGWAAGQCMTFIEEIKLSNYKKYEVVNRLKPFISNPTISFTKKGKDPQTVLNTTNYIAFTNFADAIPIDDCDRRYCVIFSKWQSKKALDAFTVEHPTYYPDIYGSMRENAGEILSWLRDYPIPAWFMSQKISPITAAKSRMIEFDISDDSLVVDDAIKAFECQDINKTTVNITKLQALASDHHEFRDLMPVRNKLKHAMNSLGYQYKNVIQIQRKNQRIYSKWDQ